MAVRVGDRAVSFALSDTDGNRHCLESYEGNWLLLVMLRHLG
ncbi:MAG: hypothetical protein BMS9Abin04_255 [Planctomycetia bacterium]|nr:MAG: hypothetical protein BMS9Abin04_255 [Planctomycetia bacterium]